MSSIFQIPYVEKCIEFFVEIKGLFFHREISKIGFRSAFSFREQLPFLKTAYPRIPVREITQLLRVSSNKYYISLEKCEKVNASARKLLVNDEEKKKIFMYMSNKF